MQSFILEYSGVCTQCYRKKNPPSSDFHLLRPIKLPAWTWTWTSLAS